MIIGDPYKFAILSGVINEWNIDNTFCNGVLLFCVNGDIYPKEVVTATLRCEIEYLKQKLRSLTIDKRLYALPPQQVFVEIYGITFPEDADSDNEDCFDITPASLSDHNCFVFAVCNGVNVRVLASELAYEMENGRHKLQDIAVSETFVSVSEVKGIISGLENFPFII